MNPSRRGSRELALQILFQSEFLPEQSKSDRIYINRLLESLQPDPAVVPYAMELVSGVLEQLEQIDSRIRAASLNWKVDRMSIVDRALLRVAVFEMSFMSPPLDAPVAITEALELAKRYSGTESTGFLNGVLDQIRRLGSVR
jgi:N utilization substance protein B